MKQHYVSVKYEGWLNSGGDWECVKHVNHVLQLLVYYCFASFWLLPLEFAN
jgi:hypothetical protein